MPVGSRRGLPEVALVVGLAALLFFPLARRYQNPDQDVPVALALVDEVHGGWRPSTLVYPTGLTNLLRAGLQVWSAVGGPATALDAVGSWCGAPWRYRVPPRAVAAASGVATLIAVLWLGGLAGGRAVGALAAILLGTSLMFVREHHHGMLDAPASAAAAWAIAAAGRFVASPSLGVLALAGACAGLATSVKYNLALALAAPATALLLAPASWGRRATGMVLVLGAAATAFAVASPGAALEPGRLWQELAAFAPLQAERLAKAAPQSGNRFVTALALGLGWPLLAAALVGGVSAAMRRTRVLTPAAAVVAGYGVVLAASPLVINRYALPLAAPLAVFAAVGVAALRRVWVRALVATALVATALPGTFHALRLLATEDTRVAAAVWIEANLAPDVRLFLACAPYAAPDLSAAMLDPFRQIPGGLGVDLPPTCQGRRRLVPALGGSTPEELAALYRDGVVVTCDHPAPELARVQTPAPLLAALRSDATLVADFPVTLGPGERVYEPFDTHYVPLRGAATVDRPGPHLQLWRVGAAPPR